MCIIRLRVTHFAPADTSINTDALIVPERKIPVTNKKTGVGYMCDSLVVVTGFNVFISVIILLLFHIICS
jgi:hypothetical protein